MQYLGSKNRLCKELVPIIQSYINKDTKGYLEPFVGGANVIDKIKHENKVGNDINKYLIALLNKIRDEVDDIPNCVEEEEYHKVKDNRLDYPDWYVGYVGFCGSYGAKYFGGYAREYNKQGKRTHMTKYDSTKNIKKQSPNLKGIKFNVMDFKEILDYDIQDYVIYCDPPYRDTTKYSTKIFNYEEYYDIVRELSKSNIVLCSEYWMPEDFECIWQKETKVHLDNNRVAKDSKLIRTEKLFIHRINIK